MTKFYSQGKAFSPHLRAHNNIQSAPFNEFFPAPQVHQPWLAVPGLFPATRVLRLQHDPTSTSTSTSTLTLTLTSTYTLAFHSISGTPLSRAIFRARTKKKSDSLLKYLITSSSTLSCSASCVMTRSARRHTQRQT